MTLSLLSSPSGHPLSNADGGGITIGAEDFSGGISTLFNGAAWAEILKRLMPEGEAWDFTGNTGLLVASLSSELATIDAYIRDSIVDLITIRSEEVLAWWESLLGMPDACDCLSDEFISFEQRRALVIDKLSARQTVTKAGLIIRAHKLGYQITIRECRPWRCGISSVADPLYSADWAHAFYIVKPESNLLWALAGSARCGDRIRTWGNQRLQCWINRAKQSHTTVFFDYGES